MLRLRNVIFCGVVVCLASTLYAEITPEVVLDGLNNPTGVAVQPKTGHLFVSDSAAGRILRVVDGKQEVVIKGFPQDVYGKGPKYNVGPLGITFYDQQTLVVGGGGLPDGEELLRIYEVPNTGADPIEAADMVANLAPLAADEKKIKGEGNFYGVAANADAVFVTCNGDDEQGWIARAVVSSGESTDEKEADSDSDKQTFAEFERYIATKKSVGVDAPTAITISPRGELVVGQMGEITEPGDSLITFYDPKSKKLLLNLPAELSDIVALAYSPDSERLYALDFSWHDTNKGALYRLDAVRRNGKQAIKPTKMIDLDKPTSMSFGEDGSLYITLFGTAKEGEDKPSGQLLKIASGL